jgi:hypothetical protein
MNTTIRSTLFVLSAAALVAAGVACKSKSSSSGADDARPAPTGEAFRTPVEAMRAVNNAVRKEDKARLESIFGAEGLALLRSADPIQDREDALQACKMIDRKLSFEDGPMGTKIAHIGFESWPFAIPLVETPEGWRFDVATGAEEVENRRIGRNELSTIATLRAFVDAQREYEAVARDGKPRAFAQKLFSSDGQHDGLYWPATDKDPESPLGPLVADAADEGRKRGDGGDAAPYHGYRFRLLRAQGANTAGGAREYVDSSGLMTGGFAAVAWPAEHDSSGVMTFLVNQRGIVYQKDLGHETDAWARGVLAFDPDGSWDPVDED